MNILKKEKHPLLFVFCFFFLLIYAHAQLPDIVINEFLAGNQITNQDPDFSDFSDWVELYNTTSATIDISGYFLTDNLGIPGKWQFPSGTNIPAGGYLLVWADGRDTNLHTNFKISKSGEELGLYNTDTVGVDSIRFGGQEDDISFGRVAENQSTWAFYNPPSPGAGNNSNNIVAITPQPLFSTEGGFYSGSQTVTFINNSGLNIYYSTDGTTPDNTSILYTEPILVDQTTAIRAIAYKNGQPPSEVITNTYFIDIPVNLPVISIVTDPDNFFDDEIGIYVTGTNGTDGYCAGVVSNVNQDWERPVNIELYEMDGSQGLNQRCGVKIFGGCSRHRYPQKSLSLFARSDYGKGSFEYKLFQEKDIDKFETFILRSSADDQVRTMFRDAAAQELMVGRMDADYQAYQPVVVYLNGDYWGIHNIREKLNEHYISGNFDVDPADVNILANNASNWNTSHGDNSGYLEMLDYVVDNNMADPAFYNSVKDMMDIDQYIDYMVGHIYMAERDWPGNNIKFWNTNSGEYTRWRWINFDLDQSLLTGWLDENMIDKATTDVGPGWPNPEWSTRLFRNLMDSPEFKNKFINHYAWHMNTTFDSTRVIAIVDSLADRLRPEIPAHIAKWGGLYDSTGKAAESWIRRTFDSIEAWEDNVEEMRVFARRRPSYTIDNFLNYFGLSGRSNISVNMATPAAGNLKIIDFNIPDGFSAGFFNDVPIKLSVTPVLGYHFSHWNDGTSDYFDPEIEITLNEDAKYTAYFSVDTTENSRLVIFNEINYSSAEDYNTEDWVEIYNSSGKTLDLSGWYFMDSSGDTFNFPNGFHFEPAQYLVLCRDTALFSQKHPTISNIIGDFNFGLSSQGELIRLVNNVFGIVDEIEYQVTDPWPANAVGTGYTIQLGDPDVDNDLGSNWFTYSLYGTPGAKNGIVNQITDNALNNPEKFALEANYPNPFNPKTMINYQLAVGAHHNAPVHVNLSIYNLLGQKVATLVDKKQAAGKYSVQWDAANFPSGVYIYKLETSSGFKKSRKLLLLK